VRIMDPPQLPAVALVRKLGAKAMPPLRQYLSRVARQTSPLLPPKDTDPRTLRLFPCKRSASVGAAKGAMIRFMDPC
jgi:hypothetical protein